MTVEHPPPTAEDAASKPPPQTAAEALRTLQAFTREQVAWLMSAAMRWGYELRVDEENGTWPPPPIFCAGNASRAVDQSAYRAACDRAARLPRLGDHLGGPANIWGEDIRAAA